MPENSPFGARPIENLTLVPENLPFRARPMCPQSQSKSGNDSVSFPKQRMVQVRNHQCEVVGQRKDRLAEYNPLARVNARLIFPLLDTLV